MEVVAEGIGFECGSDWNMILSSTDGAEPSGFAIIALVTSISDAGFSAMRKFYSPVMIKLWLPYQIWKSQVGHHFSLQVQITTQL
jgi:hypothetical protein